MSINRRAPVVVTGDIRIDAPASIVWEVVSTINDWPRWNPDIRTAALEGPLAPGSRFRWRSGPGEITSTLQEIRPGELIEWTGRTFGIKATHVWRLRAEEDRTVVVTEESWEGLPVRLFPGRSRKALDGAITSGLELLKAEAERRARALKDVAGLLVIPATGTPLTGDLVRELIDADRYGR